MHSHKLNYDDPISVFSPLLQFYFKSFIPACVLQKSGVEPCLLVILSLKPSFCILFMHSLTTMRWVLKGLIMFVVGKFETQHITVNTCLSFKYEFAIGGCLSVNLSFGLGVVWFWIMQGLTWTLSKMSSSVIEPKILGFFLF